MQPVIGILVMFSVLIPQKTWFAPNQPLTVAVKSDNPIALTLTDLTGKTISKSNAVSGPVDLKQLFPAFALPGTYLVFAGSTTDFAGTPLVVEIKDGSTQGAPPGPMVTKIEPLRYAVMTTDYGKLTCVFYYDVAPNTVDNFLTLSEGGYYDGLTFHRIVPGFVIQGGDPRGDGTGGPGYTVAAEFNDHPHLEGVLSMARSSDPNSAGSQFFVCLDYSNTRHLDNQYTAFGKVVDGMDAVKKIAATPLADPQAGTPVKAPVIQKVEVLPVTKDANPYSAIFANGK